MISHYLENKMIDMLFRDVDYPLPGTLYIALCTSVPIPENNGLSIYEVIGGNYSRRSLPVGTSRWYTTQGDTTEVSTGTSGRTGNVRAVVWDAVTWSSIVVAVAICDAPTGGNLLYFAEIESIGVIVGSKVTLASNTLTVSFS